MREHFKKFFGFFLFTTEQRTETRDRTRALARQREEGEAKKNSTLQG